MTTDNKHIHGNHPDKKPGPGFIEKLKLILQQLKALYMTFKSLLEDNTHENTQNLEELVKLLAQLQSNLEDHIDKCSNTVSKPQEQSNKQNNNQQIQNSNIDNCSVTSQDATVSSKQTQNIIPPPSPPPPPPPPPPFQAQKERSETSSKKKQQKEEDDSIKPVKPSPQELLDSMKRLKHVDKDDNSDRGKKPFDNSLMDELKKQLKSRRSGIAGDIDKEKNKKNPKLEGMASSLSQAIPYVPNSKDGDKEKPIVPPKPSFAAQLTNKSNQKNNSRDR
ncbi:hypothetical protein [Orientia tsutsugamushi]|uniref:Uncharacterized protein n=1 Tax=Orientia tsutsugamushi (strain Boryong) TaxID=357244 RepID=A5CDD8_ORITB|nr:hypothetical protein [Orientia tsutsugamushi]CAM79853.1 conserved hypothetical protein [Orientia tsutsugamushi str. Boryong]